MADEIRIRKVYEHPAFGTAGWAVEAFDAAGNKRFAPGAEVDFDRDGNRHGAEIRIGWSSSDNRRSICDAKAQIAVLAAALGIAENLEMAASLPGATAQVGAEVYDPIAGMDTEQQNALLEAIIDSNPDGAPSEDDLVEAVEATRWSLWPSTRPGTLDRVGATRS